MIAHIELVYGLVSKTKSNISFHISLISGAYASNYCPSYKISPKKGS